MGRFSCVIQAGSAADSQRAELEQRLVAHHARHYAGESAEVRWTSVPPGRMFTEARQSTSAVISCLLNGATTLDGRETYMRGVCDIWTSVTGCTDHEVVVSITEHDPTTEEVS